MKITSKIKKQINQVARIIRYGIEWGGGEGGGDNESS
jgi:hypothetical protein